MSNNIPIYLFENKWSGSDSSKIPLTILPKRWGSPLSSISIDFSLILDPSHLHLFVKANGLIRSNLESSVGEFTKGLWEGDVLELFIGPKEGTSYEEFNFSPNGAWWHGSFSQARVEDQNKRNFKPAIDSTFANGIWSLKVSIDKTDLPTALVGKDTCVANVCGIFGNNTREYFSWADINSPKPDFHRKDCFPFVRYLPNT